MSDFLKSSLIKLLEHENRFDMASLVSVFCPAGEEIF